ncbi:metal ABC transporter substrate-binding protein [Clostridium sp. BJN0013]|uniref:metal ABC transporter substrate-binding protein n=1 Tax=Clostridium sp. BJN0013 TaxID=3236840 RepID=UPI0034C61DF9
MRKILTLVMLSFIVFFTACGDKKDYKDSTYTNKLEVRKDVQLNIMATDKLLYNMVKSIVKDRHIVEYMFNNRESEINFRFTEDSINNISKKDLFFYMGASFEPWIDAFVDKLDKNKVGVINVSRGVGLLSYNKIVKYNDTTLKDNPYYFTNIDNYMTALMNIRNAVQDKDPRNRDFYEKNFSETLKVLETYKEKLKSVDNELSNYEFIIVEDELNYFVKYNNLKLVDVGLGENNIITLSSSQRENLQQKSNSGNLIILYNDDSAVKNNEVLLKKYNISAVKLQIYNGDFSYEETLTHNINALESIYKTQ